MKCKYAIKALVSMGRKQDKTMLQTADIAAEENIPRKFLEQILLELKHAGFVGSKRGYGGGYYLKLTPEEITVADVHRHFDGAIALVPCVAYQYYEKCEDCHDEAECVFRREFAKIKEQTRQVMKQTTIASFLE